jgi:hypothetical protein
VEEPSACAGAERKSWQLEIKSAESSEKEIGMCSSCERFDAPSGMCDEGEVSIETAD